MPAGGGEVLQRRQHPPGEAAATVRRAHVEPRDLRVVDVDRQERAARDRGTADNRDEVARGRVDRVHVALPATVARAQLDLLVDDERDHLRVVRWTLLDQHGATVRNPDFPDVSPDQRFPLHGGSKIVVVRLVSG
ncbi:hypothetical protein GCM10007977_032150 [Dactylosporangium sucinum]|uniref:Uncharacterized protein n=1 Tax=Dactylosporangium sucinum TaxID=1424081 RepID=A0A917TM27_9ACTN|nr:hypothetical protein GCM10007977_032150 [Dactylosporangium sucinum]